MMLHRFPAPYDDRLQVTELSYLFSSETALLLAENYVTAAVLSRSKLLFPVLEYFVAMATNL